MSPGRVVLVLPLFRCACDPITPQPDAALPGRPLGLAALRALRAARGAG